MDGRRVALGVGIGLAAVAVLVLAGVLILTRTDWGRERVRRFALERIQQAVDGQVEIGRIEGDLLRRVQLIDVSIRDRQGRPFLDADTLETRFGLRALLRQRLVLHDLRVVNPVVVLDQPPGEEWNHVRIFRIEADTSDAPGTRGWGDWVVLDDVELVNSRLVVRAEWQPPEDATPAERRAALRAALDGGSRERVIEVRGGYQNVMEFARMNAQLPRALIAHPDTTGMAFEVARLGGLVRPFSPPPARVHDLSGEVRLVRDSLYLSGVRAVLPGSRLSGGAMYDLHSGELAMIAHGAPLTFRDLRWLEPRLPEQGGGEMLMRLELGPLAERIVAWDMDVGIGDATVEGRIDVTVGDTVRFGDTDLRFARVETDLVEEVFGLDLPRAGRLTGRVALEGRLRALDVDADVAFDDRAGGSSRVVARGGLGVEPEPGFRRLRLRVSPLQATLARALVPELPVSGTIEGTALLDGSIRSTTLDADLTLRDPRHGVSRVRLAGGVDRADELRLRNLAVRLDPLRLDLLRDQVPELPAGATATGRVTLDGVPARALGLDGDLVLDDPATGVSGIGATGQLAIGDEVRFRPLRLRFSPLQAALARGVVPESPLRGTIEGTALLSGTPTVLEVEADLTLRDPRHGVSRVLAAGGIDRRDELRLRTLDLRFSPFRLDLVRGEVPELPPDAAMTGRVTLDGAPSRALRVDGDVVVNDPGTGVSRVGARGVVALEDGVRFDDLRVTADPLRVDLVRPWIPDLPAGGALAGAMSLDGDPAGLLFVDGRVAHEHPTLGTSRVQASGGVRLAGPVEFRGLDVRMDPLDVALVRPFAPDLPLGGTLRGTARLDGAPASRIAVQGDVVHEEPGERSHVAGQVDVVRGPGGHATVDVRLQPLSLDVAGRFVPAAGLRGSVSGRLRTAGDLGDLRLDADLDVAGGGAIEAEGTLDVEGTPVYDLDVRMRAFDLAAVSRRAPAETDLTGGVTARGRGLEPATMSATIAADLYPSEVDDLGADRVRLRAEVDDGLARVDSSVIRLDDAEAVLDGSFGLVAGREGMLSYRIAIDSLHAFAPWLPGADTAVGPPVRAPPPPPPPVIAAADPDASPSERDDASADSAAVPGTDPAAGSPAEEAPSSAAETSRYVALDGARVAVNVTRVQSGIERERREPRLADIARAGREAEEPVEPGDPEALDEPETPEESRLLPPADSLAGRLYAEGTLSGNVTRFDAEGTVEADGLVYGGTFVGEGDAEYAVADVGTPSPDVRLDAELRDLRTATLAFDSVSARGRYHGEGGEGAGEAVVAAFGTDDTEYRADAEFDLSLERSELRVAELMVRYDTVTWRTTRPGAVGWGGGAIELDSIEVVGDLGGRVALDGRLPADGSGDLDVRVEALELGHVLALLQLDSDAAGRLDLDAHLAGTLETPRIDGTARVDDGRLDGRDLPDVRTTFRYTGRELTAEAALLEDGRELATAEGRLPIDLSLLGGTAPRLLPGELAVDVRADSFPVEAIPGLTEQVRDARGRIRGQVAVRGTVDDPVVNGDVRLDLASVLVAPLGVRLDGVAGALSLDGDVVRVDSLVARSGGPIRVTGEIGVASLTEPTFDLEVESRETLILDTEDMNLEVDADLTIGGSLAAIEVAGEVRTRKGVIHIPELTELGATEVVSLHAPTTSGRIEEDFLEDQLRQERQTPLLDRLRLDVWLQIDRDVWVRSTELNVEIYTPRDAGPFHIRLNGVGTGLALDGTINTDRGEYEFMSRRFDLTRGAATFTAEREINPILQVAAEHEVRMPGREAFSIRVLLGGTLRDMEITLESTAQPPIAQTDLLSYLAFGRDANSLLFRQGSGLSAQGGDAGELVGNVAGLASQQLGTIALDGLLGSIEQEAMEDLGVDVFRITPADLPPDMFTGSYADLLRSTEIEAGKYLSSRLFVAGQVNSGVTTPGFRVEYVGPFGVRWTTSWASRWLPSEPTLTEQDPRRAGILGSFLFREWRF